MGVTEEVGKVGTAAVGAMQSTPLALALLLVNALFIGFCTYLLHAVAVNAAARDKTEAALIEKLVAECNRGSRPQALRWPPPINVK